MQCCVSHSPTAALTIRLDGSAYHHRPHAVIVASAAAAACKLALCSFALFFHRALGNLRFVQLDLDHVPLDGAQPSSWCECMDMCARVKTPRQIVEHLASTHQRLTATHHPSHRSPHHRPPLIISPSPHMSLYVHTNGTPTWMEQSCRVGSTQSKEKTRNSRQRRPFSLRFAPLPWAHMQLAWPTSVARAHVAWPTPVARTHVA